MTHLRESAYFQVHVRKFARVGGLKRVLFALPWVRGLGIQVFADTSSIFCGPDSHHTCRTCCSAHMNLLCREKHTVDLWQSLQTAALAAENVLSACTVAACYF